MGKSFFDINVGTADDIIVWETFKTYVRGILISMKGHNVKICSDARVKLLQVISALETSHEVNQCEEIYSKLQEKYAALNLIDTQKIRRQLLSRKQKVF